MLAEQRLIRRQCGVEGGRPGRPRPLPTSSANAGPLIGCGTRKPSRTQKDQPRIPAPHFSGFFFLPSTAPFADRWCHLSLRHRRRGGRGECREGGEHMRMETVPLVEGHHRMTVRGRCVCEIAHDGWTITTTQRRVRLIRTLACPRHAFGVFRAWGRYKLERYQLQRHQLQRYQLQSMQFTQTRVRAKSFPCAGKTCQNFPPPPSAPTLHQTSNPTSMTRPVQRDYLNSRHSSPRSQKCAAQPQSPGGVYNVAD